MTGLAILDGDAGHARPGHPERPERLAAIRSTIAADPVLAALPRVPNAPASRAALERVHAPAYLDLLETFCATGGGDLDFDTYATSASYRLATKACGGLLTLVDRVMGGEFASGFALGRPPGHHARPAQAMGFCLVSNAAVAARHAQVAHGAERVLIVDLDVHHGNGTQEAFYDDPSVLFVSTHQADLYPGSGHVGDAGVGAGDGATVNVPVPGGTGDELVDLLRAILPPLAARHQPDLVLLSFGADAHRLDALAGLGLSVDGIADAATAVLEVADAECGGRVVATLEGGYHTGALAAAVAGVLHRMIDPTALVADPFDFPALPRQDLSPLLSAVRSLHRL
ncbi:histone deacetylase [Rubrivirga sp. IMCC43871]|uniref:histone deacetylase family protein n=1 Tax=Rubrivirga sp. IMCC43871 TaxID=3391575 RepID=UPI00398FDC88